MRSLCLVQPGCFEFRDLAAPPAPGPDEALVAVRAVGICGTDLSGYLGKMPFISCPRVLGHELGVEVLAVGSGLAGIAVGDRCGVEPYLHCGTCHPCSQGRSNCCENLQVLGVHRDGGLVQRLLLPGSKLHRSLMLDFDELALVETLAIGCHAVDRSLLSQTDDALILGAGPIGLAVLEFARLTAARITVAERNASRRAFLQNHYPGIQVVESAVGHQASVVFDATGNASSMSASLALARFGGRVVYVGITREEVCLDDALFHRRELSLFASRNALSRDFPKIIRLIESRQIEVSRWISARVAFAGAPALFEELAAGKGEVVKAVVTLDEI
jgi:threonine dehydrogenase-like Zn-dependent dehydrogenase